MSGTVKLSQDMATLINNRQGSDVQFKVGGCGTSSLQENGETIYDESTTMTLYAHSCILRCRSRYFATMLDEEKNWKESSKGIIYKPNISPGTFQDVLHYIYTGNIRSKNSENIIDLIAAADEMDLEELSIGCQKELIRIVKRIFLDEDDSGDENVGIGETFEGSTSLRIPIDVAIRTHIIPALNLASSHSMSNLSQKILTIMLPSISVIIKSPGAYTTFINNISSETLIKIIASDNLMMDERSVWDLTLGWACHHINLSKDAVDTYFASFGDDDNNNEEPSERTVVNDTQLDQLKKTLEPLLPFVRFSLLDSNDYALIADALIYLLPRNRLSKLNRYFFITDRTRQLDVPRMDGTEQKVLSKIIESTAWASLRKNICETGGIAGCHSFKDLKFNLLFRASEHDFSTSIFHKRCDNKGATLILAKSTDGHLFGGVNFADWKSDSSYLSSPLNFLFALPDGRHRRNMLIFKNTDTNLSTYNGNNYGPFFMGDFYNNSSNRWHSDLPSRYDGSGASKTALAGAADFTVSDYEVFAISKA